MPITNVIWSGLSLSFALSIAVPSFAQEAADPADVPADLEVASAAQVQGQLMYRYDQAAWHGTDALRTIIALEDYPELRGYLVEPIGNGNLSLVFYAEGEAGNYEFARFEIQGSTVVGGGVLEKSAQLPLSAKLLAMAAAKKIAIEELNRQKWQFCSKSSANTLILPPDTAGNIAVYLLTSTTDSNVFPFGGHYRIDVAADGSIAEARKFTNSCLNIPLQKDPNGQVPLGIGVSHALDDTPTEIHYFQSYYVPAKVFVIIDGAAWIIDKGALDGKIEDFGK